MSVNTTKIVMSMLGNQNLLRYLSYLEDNPLDKSLPNISPMVVKQNNVVLTQFNQDILMDTKILMFINPFKGRFTFKTLANDVYAIEIIIPYKYWLIEDTGELRAFSIAYEIAKTIDQQNIAGIGDVNIIEWNSYKINEIFSGLTLFIEVTNAAIKGK